MKYPHMDRINSAIEAQGGFIQRAYRKYSQNQGRNHCKTNNPAPLCELEDCLHMVCSLAITPYIGVLTLFLGGMLLGLTVFGLEYLSYKMFKQMMISD